MKGKISVAVQNERLKYQFEIRRNLTIIRGDSATGKTTLIDMIREYQLLGKDSGINLKCEKTCAVVEGNGWKEQLNQYRESLIFVDEGNRFVSSKEFAEIIQKTDNYYILVTREALATLPYSVQEIYGMRTNGKYGGLYPAFHEMYQMYTDKLITSQIHPTKVIT